MSSLILLVQINDEIRARLNPIGHAYRLLHFGNSELLPRATLARMQCQLIFAWRQPFDRVLSSRGDLRIKAALTTGTFPFAVGHNNEAGVLRRLAILKFQ